MSSAVSSTGVVDAVPQPVLDGLYAEFSSALPSDWASSTAEKNVVDAVFTADSVATHAGLGAPPAVDVDVVVHVGASDDLGAIGVADENALAPLPSEVANDVSHRDISSLTILENGSELQGNIALVSRGADDATFVNKVKQISDAGAIGVIIVNTEDTLLAVPPAEGDDAGYKSTVPVLMIKHSDVARLREPGGALIRDTGRYASFVVSVSDGLFVYAIRRISCCSGRELGPRRPVSV